MATSKRPSWDKLEAAYLRGGVTYQELADKYAIPLRTVERQASKRSWADKRQAVAGKVADELPAQVVEIVKREMGEYLAASLQAVEGAMALAVQRMVSPGLEFKSLGEAMTAVARLAKTQADLAVMAGADNGAASDIEAALDELDGIDWQAMDPADAVRRYREECKRMDECKRISA